MDTVHRYHDYDATFKKKYLINRKYQVKFVFITLLIADYLYYTNNMATTGLRFARVVRPLLIISYSIELRRAIMSILLSL